MRCTDFQTRRCSKLPPDCQVESPGFPHKICQNAGFGPQGAECVNGTEYATFIASPQNLTRAHMAKIRTALPHARVLMYWDFNEMPLKPSDPLLCPFCTGHTMGDRPGRNCSTTYQCSDPKYNPFVRDLNRVFPTTLAIRKLYPANHSYTLVETYPGLAGYLWTEASASILSKFLSSWVTELGLDGIYLDGYAEPYLRSSTFEPTGYDYDGDGEPETPAQAAALYFAWAPAFVAMMRRRLGDSAIILANSAGSISDSNISGLTIELESCTPSRGGRKTCGAALSGQYAVTSSALGRESLSVLWLTHSHSMPPTDQCAFAKEMQATYPWVQQGTDFFDGSHIVCNETAAVSG